MLKDAVAYIARIKDLRSFQILLAVDLILIGLYVICFLLVRTGTLVDVPTVLQLAREDSIGERYSYAKWAITALTLLFCLWQAREIHFGLIAAILAMMTADDALLIHETYGWTAAEVLNLPTALGMDPKEIGEVVVFGLMGCVAFVLLALAFVSGGRDGKTLTLAFLLIILCLAVAGVALDAAHHMVGGFFGPGRVRNILNLIFTVLEDGSEIVLGSVAVGTALIAAADVKRSRATARP